MRDGTVLSRLTPNSQGYAAENIEKELFERRRNTKMCHTPIKEEHFPTRISVIQPCIAHFSSSKKYFTMARRVVLMATGTQRELLLIHTLFIPRATAQREEDHMWFTFRFHGLMGHSELRQERMDSGEEET